MLMKPAPAISVLVDPRRRPAAPRSSACASSRGLRFGRLARAAARHSKRSRRAARCFGRSSVTATPACSQARPPRRPPAIQASSSALTSITRTRRSRPRDAGKKQRIIAARDLAPARLPSGSPSTETGGIDVERPAHAPARQRARSPRATPAGSAAAAPRAALCTSTCPRSSPARRASAGGHRRIDVDGGIRCRARFASAASRAAARNASTSRRVARFGGEQREMAERRQPGRRAAPRAALRRSAS